MGFLTIGPKHRAHRCPVTCSCRWSLTLITCQMSSWAFPVRSYGSSLSSSRPCTWHFSHHCLCSWALVWAQAMFILGSSQGLGESAGPLGWVYQGSTYMRVWGDSLQMNSSWEKREPSHTNTFQGQSASVQGRDNCEYIMVSATQPVLVQGHRNACLSHVIIHVYSTNI